MCRGISRLWRCTKNIVTRNISSAALHKGYCFEKYLICGITILCRGISRLWRCTKDIVSRNILSVHGRYYIADYFFHWRCTNNIIWNISFVALHNDIMSNISTLRCIKNIVSQNISSVALHKGYCVAKYLICGITILCPIFYPLRCICRIFHPSCYIKNIVSQNILSVACTKDIASWNISSIALHKEYRILKYFVV